MVASGASQASPQPGWTAPRQTAMPLQVNEAMAFYAPLDQGTGVQDSARPVVPPMRLVPDDVAESSPQLDHLAGSGFELSVTSPTSVAVRSVPWLLKDADPIELTRRGER